MAFISGNSEIGNGYGVPGGGAYLGASVPNIVYPSKSSWEWEEGCLSVIIICLLKMDLCSECMVCSRREKYGAGCEIWTEEWGEQVARVP